MTEAITDFRGKYFFLSNFSPATLRHGGIEYPTLEHCYQTTKVMDMGIRRAIAICPTPGDAKRMGRRLKMRDDWNRIKVDRMRLLLRRKFRNPDLATKLLLTSGRTLIEGNDWGDKFWGAVWQHHQWRGENMLGQLLMEFREECMEQLVDRVVERLEATPEGQAFLLSHT